MKKYSITGFAVLTLILLWSAVYGGSALAEMELGGKIETNLRSTIDRDGSLQHIWQEHLNLDFLLPDLGDTSARFEIDLYYEPQNVEGVPEFRGDVSKLYLKQRFERWQLTLGRQPITWSFGSLVNPVDFTVSADMMQLSGQGMSENAALVYLPLGWASSATVVASWPELGKGPKFGMRGRTDLAGFDLTATYVREPEKGIEFNGMTFTLPVSQRLAVTAKGDLGPVGMYGAAGYTFGDTLQNGKPVYVLGADYSFDLPGGSKLLVQAEYLRDEAGAIQQAGMGPDLVLGTLGYEIDEFAGVSLFVGMNPKDHSLILAPLYKNQIGSGLDLNVSGAIFIGDAASQFGPKTVMPGVTIPRALIQVGVGYPF